MTSKLDSYTLNTMFNNDIFIRGLNIEEMLKMRLIHPLFKKAIESKMIVSVTDTVTVVDRSIKDVKINKTTFRGLYAVNEIEKIEDRLIKMNILPLRDVKSVTIVTIELTDNISCRGINPFNSADSVMENINNVLIEVETSYWNTLHLSVMYINNEVLPSIIQLDSTMKCNDKNHYNYQQVYCNSITTLIKMNDQLYVGECDVNSEHHITKRIHIFRIDDEVITITDDPDIPQLYLYNGCVRCQVRVDNDIVNIQYVSRMNTATLHNWIEVTDDRDDLTPAMYKALFSSLSELYVDYYGGIDEDEEIEDEEGNENINEEEIEEII